MSDEIKKQEFTNTEEIMSYGDVMLEDYGNQKWVSVESELAWLKNLEMLSSDCDEEFEDLKYTLESIHQHCKARIKQLEKKNG